VIILFTGRTSALGICLETRQRLSDNVKKSPVLLTICDLGNEKFSTVGIRDDD
jgi:hypothetical protein